MPDAHNLASAYAGVCPMCREAVTFTAPDGNLRVTLSCPVCAAHYNGSIVRNRAVYHAFALHRINPPGLAVHEIAPAPYGASVLLSRECANYTPTNFWPERPIGETYDGVRNENAERTTFESESFDLVVSMDVMEHVNHPDRVFADVHRTLRPDGCYVFTAPTYPHMMRSKRVALFKDDGSFETYEDKPEYHGNPINPVGSLVTWRYGYDFPALIRLWADFDVTVLRFDAPGLGLMGYFTETYVCRKR